MSEIKMESAYNLKFISSRIDPYEFDVLDSIAEKLTSGYIILWQHHGVFAGEIKDAKITWNKTGVIEKDTAHIVRIRAFNESTEFHIWRSGNDLKVRKRVDVGESANEQNIDYTLIPIVNTIMVLRAVIAQQITGCSKIMTRNYINQFDENNFQAAYSDSRLVKFL